MSTIMTSTSFYRFAENLRRELARREMSQQDLAKASGVHYVVINRILNEAVDDVKLDTVDRIAHGLNLESSDLLKKSRKSR